VGRASFHRPSSVTGASLLVHPAIAQSCASAIGGVVADPEGGDRLADVAVGGSDLLCRFGGIGDGWASPRSVETSL
ncbi:MAG TPA: hypothetical protein VM677_11185, partial [Actinokineospora sp.]|nr:hypothetical protein [Actinokineospora sp.]